MKFRSLKGDYSWRVVVCTAALSVVGDRPAGAQHVHGVIELGIVLESSALAVTFRAPLADLVGFEHEPDNDAQAERLQLAATLLMSADAMFGTPEPAGCVVQEVTVDGPVFLRDAPEFTEHGEHKNAVESPTDSANHADHTLNSHDHAEVDARYVWECAQPSRLDALEARFVSGFERIDKVRVQILTSSHARYFEADGRLDSISIRAQ